MGRAFFRAFGTGRGHAVGVEESEGMRKAILIVDDSKFARLMLRNVVSGAFPECFVCEAGSGDEAYALLQEMAPDYVLIDYNMPGEDGLAVAARLRQSHPAAKLALVTANVQDSVSGRAKDLGVVFIGKPIDRAAVTAFIGGA